MPSSGYGNLEGLSLGTRDLEHFHLKSTFDHIEFQAIVKDAIAIEGLSAETIDISEIVVRESDPIPNQRAFYDATAGPFEGYAIKSITLVDSEGMTGESPMDSALHPDIMEKIIVPILLNRKATYTELYDTLYWSIRNFGFRSPAVGLIGAIDIALHDIAAKRANTSLSAFLGATRNWSKCYMSGGSVHLSDAELIEELNSYLESGHTIIKVKAGDRGEAGVDKALERVKAIRENLGYDFELAIDFNQALSVDGATRFANEAAIYDVLWIEEPVHTSDLTHIHEVCMQSSIAISYGESEFCSRSFKNLLNMGVRHFQPIPMKFAGIAEYQAVQGAAAKNELQFSSGGYSWLSAEFISAGRDSDIVEFLAPVMSCAEPYLKQFATIENGRFHIPESIGMAFSINWEKIEGDGFLRSAKRFHK